MITNVNANDVAAILAAVAWPFTTLIVVLYFRTPLNSLVKKLADSLTLIKITVGKITVEATIEQTKNALQEMLEDTINGLEVLDFKLFQDIDNADARKTVKQLLPKFVEDVKKGEVNEEHEQLRRLRDRKLIRPIEGSSWKDGSHPIVTRFARLVQKVDPKLLSEPKPKSG